MTAPVLQNRELLWGDLQLVDVGESESAFDIEVLARDTHFGNPIPIIEQVRTLAMEGPLARITGWEAREFPLRIRISGNDGEQLASAEAALVAQCMMVRPPALAWTGPVSLSAPNVFDVMVARLEEDTSEGWDLGERVRGARYFILTMTCLTWVRALETTLIEALAAPTGAAPATTVVDDGSAVNPAGTYSGSWTRETNGGAPSGPTAVTSFGQTAIEVSAVIDNPADYLHAVRSFNSPLAIPADNYLVVDAKVGSVGGVPSGAWKLRVGATDHAPVLAVAHGGEGNVGTRLYFDGLPASVSSFKVLYDFTTDSDDEVDLHVFRVAVTDTLGGADTTTRQQGRRAEVFGTVPTRATIRLYVADDAVPLGEDILIYATANVDARMALRSFFVSGQTPAEVATAVSGKMQELTTPSVYRVPAEIFTSGSYALMARVSTDGAVAGTLDLTWQVRMVDEAGAATFGSDLIQSGEVTLPDVGGLPNYAVVNLAERLSLPPFEVETDNFMVEFTFTASAAVGVDEVWAFSLDDGALTWVHGQDEATVIEVRSPELGAPRPSVWGGTSDRMANMGRSCLSFGAHRFEPGPMQLFTVTSNALISQCEMEYFPRFHSHVWAAVTE